MRRTSLLIAVFAAFVLAGAPALVLARAGTSSSGAGSSMGSRGSRTFSTPAPTNTAPSAAAPMQRSMTPAPAADPPGAAVSSAMGSYGAPRSPFMSGLMGGLLGAGIGGLLFGGGMFGGVTGVAGFLGLLLQIGLLALLVRFLIRRFAGSPRPAFAGPNVLARGATAPRPGPMAGRGGSATPSIALATADFQAFEQSLGAVQSAWSRRDLAALESLATPEMVSYFADQLAEQASRGVRNTVTEVKLEQGDVAEAWAERGREYATVAMRFSMVDVTRDRAGDVVDGHPAEHVQATEVWTFVRSPGGRWLLSAIQQTH